MSDLSPADQAQTLVAAMAAGDRAALAGLIRLYGRGIESFAARTLGNVTDAEDIAQEVFLRAWRQAHRYDPTKAAVSTWLYRIAVNLCIDQRRRRGLRQFLGLDTPELGDGPIDPAPGAEQTTDARQRLARLAPALARLPERQRMALLLKAVAGLDTAGVAQALSTSPGAIEQLLVRARSGLRADLEEETRQPRDTTRKGRPQR